MNSRPPLRRVMIPIREQIGFKVRVNRTGFQPAVMADECHEALGIFKPIETPPPTSDGYHTVHLSLVPPYEMDIIFLDVSILSDGGDAKEAADWLSRMYVGYGFGPRKWTASPLWTWQSRWIERFIGHLPYNLSTYARIVKENPDLRGTIAKTIESHMDATRRMQEGIIDAVQKDTANSFSVLARSHYYANMTDHLRRARHLISREELNLYMRADNHDTKASLFPDKELVLGMFLTGIIYKSKEQ